MYDRLAAVQYPTLALIRGHCMGGGTELALACRYRVVVDEPGTRIALPEVMLGIVPGWGGMMRLPQVIGPAAALDMMLSGRALDASARSAWALPTNACRRASWTTPRACWRCRAAAAPAPSIRPLLNGR